MKAKTLALLAGAGGSLLIAGQANAGFTGISSTVNEVSSAGFTTAANNATVTVIQLFANFDGTDATDALQAIAGTGVEALDWELQGAGTFYQGFFDDPLGGPPSVALATFPSMAADTFLTIGVDRSNDLSGFAIDPGGSLVLTSTTLSTTGDGWGVSGIPTNSGRTSINGNSLIFAQMTLDGGTGLLLRGGLVQVSSNGVVEQFLISSLTDDGGNNGGVGLFIPTGGAVPAPGALALLGLAGLVGGRRRRRA